MGRLSRRQTDRLVSIACPGVILLTPRKRDFRLVELGYARQSPAGAMCITAACLRRLADEMDAGRLDDALEAMRKQREARGQ